MEGYEDAVHSMVAESAPRRFAVFQDFGDRVDGRVAAWGMAFDDRAEIVDTNGSTRLSTTTPEQALGHYVHLPEVTSRIIWVDTP